MIQLLLSHSLSLEQRDPNSRSLHSYSLTVTILFFYSGFIYQSISQILTYTSPPTIMGLNIPFNGRSKLRPNVCMVTHVESRFTLSFDWPSMVRRHHWLKQSSSIVVIVNCYALSGESLKPAEDWKRPVNVARALPAAAAATAFTPLFQLRSDATAMRCGGMPEDGDTQLCVQGIIKWQVLNVSCHLWI